MNKLKLYFQKLKLVLDKIIITNLRQDLRGERTTKRVKLVKEHKIVVFIATVGIILFILTALTFPFRNKLFSSIFPKPFSQASGINDVLEVKKANGDSLDYIGNDTYNIDTLDIKIKIKPQN